MKWSINYTLISWIPPFLNSQMKYIAKKKIENYGIAEIQSDRMVLATIKGSPKVLGVCDSDLNFLWRLEIDKYARYIPVNEEEGIILDDHQTVFINLLNGKIVSEEKNKFYLAKTELYKVSFDINSGRSIVVEFQDRRVEIQTGSINGLQFFGDHLVQFFYTEKKLKCYALQSGKAIWELDIKELLQSANGDLFSQVVGHKGYLFFFLSDLNEKAVFKVELTTGKVLHKTQEAGGWITLSKDKLYVANQDHIKILHPDTFKIETIDFSKALEPHGFRIQWNKFLVVDDRFYFVHENARGGGEAVVGVLNTTSRELLWYTTIPVEEGSFWISNIKAHANRLYVETQGGTLHVFEQTD